MSYIDERLDTDLGKLIISIARGTIREELARIILDVHRDGYLQGKSRGDRDTKDNDGVLKEIYALLSTANICYDIHKVNYVDRVVPKMRKLVKKALGDKI